MNRREFITSAGAGIAAAAVAGSAEAQQSQAQQPQQSGAPGPISEKDRLARIASCTWPIRYIFKTRGTRPPSPQTIELKQKYGEITMLDFPQFTKDTFPGVTHMDLFSGLFGDVSDASMYDSTGTFDPSTPSGRKWLDKLVAKMAATGTKVQHVSNNAPTNLASTEDAARKAGVEVGKKWLDAAAILGARSVRMNSPRALGPGIRPQAVRDPKTGYPRNDEIPVLLAKAIESYKEMADYGANLGVRATIENHWGLAADPINIRIILDTLNHPYCEASPDFCNWEYAELLVSGLKALAPYAHTNVHAKYWDRWGEKNDVQRSTRIMMAAGYTGTFALEYEEGPLNGIEGAKYLYREVLAALATPM